MASLRDLGLSEYESAAYRGLLRLGPSTAKELSHVADVPMGRIYDVLNSLEGSGLVRSQTSSRPKKYVGVEPETGLDRLLAERLTALDREKERYEAIVDELSGELDAHTPVDGQFWTAAVGPEESADLLVERLAAATERVRMVAGTPSAKFDIGRVSRRVVDQLGDTLERGAEVSLLLSTGLVESVPDAIWDDYHRQLATSEAFEARVGGDIEGTFNVIDGVEVCLEVSNPLEPTEAFAMIDLKDPTFTAQLTGAFDDRWTDAEPLSL